MVLNPGSSSLEIRACRFLTNEVGKRQRTKLTCFDGLRPSVLHTERCDGVWKEDRIIVDVERYSGRFAKDKVSEEVGTEVLDQGGGLNWKTCYDMPRASRER